MAGPCCSCHPGNRSAQNKALAYRACGKRRLAMLARGRQLRKPDRAKDGAGCQSRQQLLAQSLIAAIAQAATGSIALTEDKASRQTGAGKLFVAHQQLDPFASVAPISGRNAPPQHAAVRKSLPGLLGPGCFRIRRIGMSRQNGQRLGQGQIGGHDSLLAAIFLRCWLLYSTVNRNDSIFRTGDLVRWGRE